MPLESEIKLALPRALRDAAQACLRELAGTAGVVLPLGNRYFDTPEQSLARARCALRVRRTPSGWLQTLKGGGGSVAGLHVRSEWELPIAGDALDIGALLAVCDDPDIAARVRAAAPVLSEYFRSDFTRTRWDVRWQGAVIEAALDEGEISASANGSRRAQPLFEIELEFKSGDHAEAALTSLARHLTARLPGAIPDDTSKAERGYALYAALSDVRDGPA